MTPRNSTKMLAYIGILSASVALANTATPANAARVRVSRREGDRTLSAAELTARYGAPVRLVNGFTAEVPASPAKTPLRPMARFTANHSARPPKPRARFTPFRK